MDVNLFQGSPIIFLAVQEDKTIISTRRTSEAIATFERNDRSTVGSTRAIVPCIPITGARILYLTPITRVERSRCYSTISIVSCRSQEMCCCIRQPSSERRHRNPGFPTDRFSILYCLAPFLPALQTCAIPLQVTSTSTRVLRSA